MIVVMMIGAMWFDLAWILAMIFQQKRRFITMCAKVISNVTDESLTSTASLLFSAHLRNMHKLMVDEWGDNETAYSEKQMKTALENHYGDNISITTVGSKPNVVTLRENVKMIIHETHVKSQKEESTAQELIEAVGKIIRSEIKAQPKIKEEYPSLDDMSSLNAMLNYLPPSLKSLLSTIFKSKHADLHVASIGQAIMLATCPRSFLPPILLGLAITVQHKYGHRSLGDLLNKFGFASSYTEASTFRRVAAGTQGVDLDLNDNVDSFLQWIADNVDHGTETLDVNNTVHMMGIMGTVTPGVRTNHTLKRRRISDNEILEIGKINIVHYQIDPKSVYPRVLYTSLGKFTSSEDEAKINTLYSISRHFTCVRQPSWSGQMQMLQINTSNPGRSSEYFLPMLDLKPTDPVCIRSKLEYLIKQAHKYNTSAVITFDQQL